MDVLHWLRHKHVKIGTAALEAADSGGIHIKLFREHILPLTRYPAVAQKVASMAEPVNWVILANFLVCPYDCTEKLLEYAHQ